MAKKEDTHTSAIALQFTEQYGPVGVGPARVARYLERQGLLKHDTGDSHLTAQAVDAPDDDPPHHLLEGQLLAVNRPFKNVEYRLRKGRLAARSGPLITQKKAVT